MASKKVLIIGGSGALGRSIVGKFAPRAITCNIDLAPNKDSKFNISVKQPNKMYDEIPDYSNFFKTNNLKFDAIFCAAGGWNGTKSISNPFRS